MEAAADAAGIEHYFRGQVRAWGMFEDRFGRVQREFTAEIAGRSDGGDLILDEQFHYADGDTEARAWRIRRVGDALYEGWCDDVPGVARGSLSGNVIRWRYRFNLRLGGRRLLVDFDERMFLRSDRIAIDRSYLSKWGVRLGSVTLVYHKV